MCVRNEMTELPCFLSTEHSSFLLGNCGYGVTSDPIVSVAQSFPFILLGMLCGGFVYLGLKAWNEKRVEIKK